MTEVLDKPQVAPAIGFKVGDNAFLIYNAHTEDEYLDRARITEISDLCGQTMIKTDRSARLFARVLSAGDSGEVYQRFIAPYKVGETLYLVNATVETKNRWIAQEASKKMQTIADRAQVKYRRIGHPGARLAASPEEMVAMLESVQDWIKFEKKDLS